MNVRIKLMGLLKDRTPSTGALEIPDDTTIDQLLKLLDVESSAIQAVTVNGSIERDKHRTLADDDEIIVLPPVGGG